MRAMMRAATIAIALGVFACDDAAETGSGASSNDLEIGEIETTARDQGDGTVVIDLHWTFRQREPTMSVSELPPVYLFNENLEIRAIPEPEEPSWDGGQVSFRSTIKLSEEEWRQGCWQTFHDVGWIATGPITCINQGS